MENTYVKGVLLKKGESKLTCAEYEKIKESPVFKNYLARKWVVEIGRDEEVKKITKAVQTKNLKTKSTSQKKGIK